LQQRLTQPKEVDKMTGINRRPGNMGSVGMNSRILGQKNQNMSRGGFVKTVGVGVAALGVTASGLGGVARATGGIINVPPATGDSTIDTTNIQTAMDLAVANPGSTVLFPAGHYKVHKEIYTEGFDGSVAGAGMDSTIIEAVRKSPAPGDGFEPVFYFQDQYVPDKGTPRPSIFMFIRSDNTNLTITDMTLKCDDPAPCEVTYWDSDLQTYIKANFMAAFISDFYGKNTTTTTERVRMEGQPIKPQYEVEHNVECGIISWRGVFIGHPPDADYPKGRFEHIPEKGALTVRSCETERVDYGVFVNGDTDAPLLFDNNNVVNCWNGFSFYNVYDDKELNSSTLEVGYNNFTNVPAPVYLHSVNCERYADIHDNTITGLSYHAFHLQEYVPVIGEVAPLIENRNIIIRNNTIKDFKAYQSWCAPVYLRSNNRNCFISGNKFINISEGIAAIFVRGLNNNYIHIGDYDENGFNDYTQSNLFGWPENVSINNLLKGWFMTMGHSAGGYSTGCIALVGSNSEVNESPQLMPYAARPNHVEVLNFGSNNTIYNNIKCITPPISPSLESILSGLDIDDDPRGWRKRL